MRLSILIPTLEKRERMFNLLMNDLQKQIKEHNLSSQVEIIFSKDNGEMSIGEKRNWLLSQVKTEYFSYVDDDDRVHYNYLPILVDKIRHEPDCVELKGIISTNGIGRKPFIHSIKYKHYFEQNGTYYRPPNHLNCIRTELVKDITFPDMDFSEDTSWAMEIVRQNRLKTMEPVSEPIYYYDYVTNK